jgi:hypothetical protein
VKGDGFRLPRGVTKGDTYYVAVLDFTANTLFILGLVFFIAGVGLDYELLAFVAALTARSLSTNRMIKILGRRTEKNDV